MTQSSIQFFLALCPDKWLALNTYCRCITVCIHKRFSSFFFWGGGGFVCTVQRGTLKGTQYRNTVWKIGKYRNTVSKMDEIPIPHLSSVTLTYNVVSISRVFFFFYLKHLYTRNQPWPSRENMRRSRIDRYNDRKARSLDVLPHHRVTVRNCVFIYN